MQNLPALKLREGFILDVEHQFALIALDLVAFLRFIENAYNALMMRINITPAESIGIVVLKGKGTDWTGVPKFPRMGFWVDTPQQRKFGHEKIWNRND